MAGENGTTLTTASLRGRGSLLLFVPSAFTPVCTSEIRAHAAADLSASRLVIISCDTAHTLVRWLAAEDVATGQDVLVGSDFWPHGEVARSFGAFDAERGWPRRVSVLLDAAGMVRWVTVSPAGVARSGREAAEAVATIAGGAGSVSV